MEFEMESIIEFVTIIDVIFAKANLAKKYNYCKPIIKKSSKSFVNAKGIRHCLIENLQNDELYVANDIFLGVNEMEGNEMEGNEIINGILLYGTNAVGKTSLIRALGITIIMAQAGLYVPCSSFIYYPYKYIFTRILGNDNIFKGLSTFAVEMSELRTILRLADDRSLILGDELCSGTEVTSAISIFVAGIQKLIAKSCNFIFATHLHEITEYEEIKDMKTLAMKHMKVIYNREKDMLIYDRKLCDGPGDNMYGLEVCKSLNLPDDFLEMANHIRMKYNPESASILSLKSSHFNSKKIVGICENCHSEIGKEIHHLQYQSYADENGKIKNTDGTIFHKNNVSNLMTLCENCHQEIHKQGKMHKRVKTTKGYKIIEIS
jgi:DNA mismatch repair protein MutS